MRQNTRVGRSWRGGGGRLSVRVVAAVATAVSVVALSSAAGPIAQKTAPADLAAQLSGTWVLNRELSPGFRAPGGRPGGPGRGALFAAAPSSAAAPALGQRGGGSRGGGGDLPIAPSDLSPAELAAQAAMRELQQISDVITIAATAETVSFSDARGERTYTIDGKSAKILVAGSEVSTKTRWDKASLKQEFSTPQTKLMETWFAGADGRLTLVAKVESLRLVTPERKAVFDRR